MSTRTKGLNPHTQSVNPLTISVNYNTNIDLSSERTVLLSNLISLKTFLNEMGMSNDELLRYRKDNRVQGLVKIANKVLVDRSAINILFKTNGVNFRKWVALGGRKGPVSVKENRAYEEPVSIKDLPGDHPIK